MRESATSPQSVSEEVAVTHVSRMPTVTSRAALLATVRVRVLDSSGQVCEARALLDQGAATSLVSESFVRQLRLPRRRSSVQIMGIGGKTISRGQVTLTTFPHDEDSPITVSALIHPSLPAPINQSINRPIMVDHLQGLRLADPTYWTDDSFQLLLSAQVYGMILLDGLKRGKASEPIAQSTTFGWILSGAVGRTSSESDCHAYHCAAEDEVTSLVRKFWEQEELPSVSSPLSKEDEDCEVQYAANHIRRADGRYIVRLPVREPLPDLSSSYAIAVSRLHGMERRFARDDALRTQYNAFMRDYAALGHMSVLEPQDQPNDRVAYLPHHGVWKANGSPKKLRMVFNGSATLDSGVTLNQYLASGPNLLPHLVDVLTEWRGLKVAFVCDIEKMYRQFLIHPADRDLQRVVWRFAPDKPILIYQLNTVTYGTASAPYLATRSLRQLARDEQHNFPEAAKVLTKSTYVDDMFAGAANLEAAKELMTQLIDICMAGGMPLKKWASNSPELLTLVSRDDQHDGVRTWETRENPSTLGLLWCPRKDAFSFSVTLDPKEKPTKRNVLSQTARLFDPLGWLAPITVRAKISLQNLWLIGLDWDDVLPSDETRTWETLREELPLLSGIRVLRWLGTGENNIHHEVHGFSDASEKAYAAVVYLRSIKPNGEITVTLIAGKTKVTPLKRVTLPRLELCAAHLLVNLVKHLRAIDGLQIFPVYFWTDSSVVLGWIQGHPSRRHTYVTNRVSAIQCAMPEAKWHHVPGTENPADCASRGLLPRELISHSLWWQGPGWLHQPVTTLPQPDSSPLEELPESRPIKTLALTAGVREQPAMLARFSTLRRLLRVTTWIMRWRHGQRIQPPRVITMGTLTFKSLTMAELSSARKSWIRAVQGAVYVAELKLLHKDMDIGGRSSLRRFNPFVDQDGLLRIGGRLRHAVLSVDQKHPIILPADSHLTQLIVKEAHELVLHGGVQATLAALRRKFWVPRGRAVVKTIIHHCVRCVRWRAETVKQFMADLPVTRVTRSRLFLHTGLDYAGPVRVRVSKGRGNKSYKGFMCIFVCFSSRAVHIELVSDYTSEAFLAVFRRFVARRGLPSDLYSDQGTTFVGADHILKDLFNAKKAAGRKIYEGLERLKVEWHWNPPSGPHFGGLWEAAVKSVKHHLRRVIGEATLTYEELATLLSQIEACLNSRSLQALSDDPDDLEVLTPGHLLIGAPLLAIPEPSLMEATPNRLTRWELIQQMRDHFWYRWEAEYLNAQLHWPKWWQACPVVVGQLCLIASELSSQGDGRWHAL